MLDIDCSPATAILLYIVAVTEDLTICILCHAAQIKGLPCQIMAPVEAVH